MLQHCHDLVFSVGISCSGLLFIKLCAKLSNLLIGISKL